VKELGLKLGTTPEAVQETLQHASSRFVSLEHVLQEGSREDGAQRWDPVDTDEHGDPAAAADRKASLTLLDQAVQHLPPRDQTLLRLRYGESRPFHEVGRVLGLSESRVCQLHKRILRQLRRHLATAIGEAA
jgi:RNA polymerase sigma factor (sigma-70 family)